MVLGNFIKRLRCVHEYHETTLTYVGLTSGGHREFICVKCLKSKDFYVYSIDGMLERQRLDIKLGRKRKFYIRAGLQSNLHGYSSPLDRIF